MSDAVSGRPFIIRTGKKVRPLLNILIARNSPVPDTPVLDTSLFPWIADMERQAFRRTVGGCHVRHSLLRQLPG
ncbi:MULTISPECIES: hypothetical protein [Komagataeibacter]|uniref:hypothetical protein n=1 Tax=Komagataeibacter TaxID=1434011 RepID=UPI001396873D|nr:MULTISPECIES: hypothetical protein [Komagataeibacter]